MSTTEPPLLKTRSDRPDDDLDGLLRDFFRAELPGRWPAAPEPVPLSSLNGHANLASAARPSRPVARPWAWSSRLALAASVGGLLLGTMLLSGQFKGNQPLDNSNLGQPAGDRVRMHEMLEIG